MYKQKNGPTDVKSEIDIYMWVLNSLFPVQFSKGFADPEDSNSNAHVIVT